MNDKNLFYLCEVARFDCAVLTLDYIDEESFGVLFCKIPLQYSYCLLVNYP